LESKEDFLSYLYNSKKINLIIIGTSVIRYYIIKGIMQIKIP